MNRQEVMRKQTRKEKNNNGNIRQEKTKQKIIKEFQIAAK